MATATDEPIRLRAIVRRCDHNRKFKSLEIISGPPHVMRHCTTGGPQFGEFAQELIETLSQYGYEYTVATEFEDVSIEEMVDILGDENR